jgi:hypothetical protein
VVWRRGCRRSTGRGSFLVVTAVRRAGTEQTRTYRAVRRGASRRDCARVHAHGCPGVPRARGRVPRIGERAPAQSACATSDGRGSGGATRRHVRATATTVTASPKGTARPPPDRCRRRSAGGEGEVRRVGSATSSAARSAAPATPVSTAVQTSHHHGPPRVSPGGAARCAHSSPPQSSRSSPTPVTTATTDATGDRAATVRGGLCVTAPCPTVCMAARPNRVQASRTSRAMRPDAATSAVCTPIR